ncbi:multicopper oxidase domain-containing protein [Chelatococcus sp. SYSU_G07232]|uniref:Copper-containing nitrite reductase n=1 Tax=Chelatococcus albus TaxID=3047466 RepID=A0ABT7ABV3_9HYPH|nr:multicopper oxidase domain-containing protein [Chelatococcus sp. SYSU_G07232]MDJ1156803.1 multicopper oxidase domain-containing protein [Chelatococcus sp. SYSU_G07232]
MRRWFHERISRRGMLSGSAAAAGGALLGAFAGERRAAAQGVPVAHGPEALAGGSHTGHGNMITVGTVDDGRNGFDPAAMLTDWNTGTISRLPDGSRLRTFEIVAQDKEIEIAPGVIFPAWTYNGRVPGPTLRATEGDRLRIVFRNEGSHPHTMHFHGMHAARMDGVPGAGEARPGGEFIYEFDALPFGCHLYHCHAEPLKRHIHKGLYGAFIIDPDPTRHPEHAAAARSRLLGTDENRQWQEFVMVMNGFDTDFDGENEIYAVNTVAHHFLKNPIRIERRRPVRIYIVNILEFDPINSFHLHGNFFDYYDQGTTLAPTLRTVDTVMLCQAQRGILEFTYRAHEAGAYMFHAHQSEFAELGWMGVFDVVEVAS